ncbi:unnamed protein product, partial [Ixodes pacificus]
LPPLVAAELVAALVEGGHGLVGRPSLDLHKIGPLVATLGALLFGRVNVLPGGCTAEHVVHVLEPRVLPVRHLRLDIVHIGACVAGETEALQALFHDEDVGARRAEQQHLRLVASL